LHKFSARGSLAQAAVYPPCVDRRFAVKKFIEPALAMK
jgi:hypothetical protein